MLRPNSLSTAKRVALKRMDQNAFIVQRANSTRGTYGTDPSWTDHGSAISGAIKPFNPNLVTTTMVVDYSTLFVFVCPWGTDILDTDRIRRLSDSAIFYVKNVGSPRSGQPITLNVLVSTAQ